MKLKVYILTLISIFICNFTALALDASHYATNSVLSEGRWRRIKISGTGMQLVTTTELKAMGFSDPSKVHVYGTGGHVVREALTSDMPDDLPQVKSMVTSKGLIFFGVDNTSWNYRNAAGNRHTLNPFVNESYYFLSDRQIEERPGLPSTAEASKGERLVTTFEERISYEKDYAAPHHMGRMLFGEDFRSTKNQTFNFSLPDIASSQVTAAITFGAKTTGGSSQLKIFANGEALPSNSLDVISNVQSEEFVRLTSTVKNFNVTGDKLALTIDYSYSGALFFARLDHIEVFYDRALRLSGSELHFYKEFQGETVALDGCSQETVVWDVTQAWRPVPVDYILEGNTAYFTPKAGYHEYIAFNPSAAGRSITRAGDINNQDIHGIPSPDMLIIAPSGYMEAANKIAALHREHDGFTVEVLTPEKIYNEFSGGHADVSAFRKLLKMWYDRPGERKIGYCLILGRPIYDYKLVASGSRNAGYIPVPQWSSPTGYSEITAFSTDDYIGMLDDCTEQTFEMSSAKMQVAVGRLPVKNVTEANQMADKIVKYVKNPVYGNWRNRAMLIADDQDEAIHFLQTEDVWSTLVRKAPHYQYEKLYLDSYPLESTGVGNTYPKAKERMFRLWNEGVIYTNYVGHASPTSWTHEKLMLWGDITSMSNTNLFFLIAATCAFGNWDGDDVSGAEVMVLNPTAGMIGAIVPSRTVFMTMNGVLNKLLAEHILTTDSDGKCTRVGDAFVRAKNAYRDENKLRYCLMADPALRLPKATHTVDIESVNGIELSTATEFPQLEALSKAEVKGKITNLDGTPVNDFDGTVILDLYDAEAVVETLGNGKGGVKLPYNDRKSKLASVSAKVVKGEWSTTLMLPAEIANNMSPARIVAYAYSDQGVEAGGSTESIFVAGYPEKDSEDKEGPTITEMYLNHSGYNSDEPLNSNPVLHASFFDESGINISESGIGHKMSVTLDNDQVFDDVTTCYRADPDNALGGSIAYPLTGISAGEHTLKFTVYDNANNATSKLLTFNVAEVKGPSIRALYTDVNPASTSVVFTIEVDHPNTNVTSMLEVFDLSGKRVWWEENKVLTDLHGGIQIPWDLRDMQKRRVARGIYLYRARIETSDGMHCSQTRKLAVTAQ